MKRQPVVERRGLFRRNPEQILLADEDAQGRRDREALERERQSETELDLERAIGAYAAERGWASVACWLAARARRIDAGVPPARVIAEGAFRRRVA